MITVGDEIAAERRRMRLTQVQAALLLGITTQTLSDIERGKVGIDESEFNRIITRLREQNAKSVA